MKLAKLFNINKLYFLLLTCAVLVGGASWAEAQTLRERHEQLRAALDKGDVATAWMNLQTLRAATTPELFAANNYDYLTGRLAQQRGDVATANAAFQGVVARQSPLTQYALWHLAQLARMTGNLPAERNYLRQLAATAPDSRLRPAAVTRLANSFFESQDYPSVIATLKPLTGDVKNVAARPALALLAQAYLANNQADEARPAFTALVTNLPNAAQPDDYALAAARALDQLDGSPPDAPNAPQLPEIEHLRRAQIYHFNRDFAGARRHWLALVNNYPQSLLRANALFQLGRGYALEGKFGDALPYYQRVLTEYPDRDEARDALLNQAGALVRLDKIDEALAAYQKYITDHPDADNIERPYLNIIDALRDSGRDADALKWVERTRNDLKGKPGAALALFSQARIHNAQGAWAEVVKDCDLLANEPELGGTRFPGGTTKTEVAFMRAYALEQLGKIDDAVNAYLALPDGRNEYYGGRATLRLRALAAHPKYKDTLSSRAESLYATAVKAIDYKYFEEGRKAAQDALRLTEDEGVRSSLLDLARRAYAGLPAYSSVALPRLLPAGRAEPRADANAPAAPVSAATLADELLFLGLYDEGAPELVSAGTLKAPPAPTPLPTPSASPTPTPAKPNAGPPVPAPGGPPLPDVTYTLATLFHRGQEENRALAYIESYWRTVPPDYLLELAPRELVELLYPAPYRAALLQYAPPRQLDPRMVLSIARQESRFRADAKSVAAARGMMQFISATANTIAQQLKLNNFRQDDLYDPRVAIQFGAQYLSNLYRQFPDQPQAVAASYNGGEDNVARWLKRAKTNDPDRYVPEINFSQSKDYVWKTLTNLALYQAFYDEKLERRN